ncbi:GNAT family N-acetyltransferase [Aquibium oceanicum]|uniref:BioF2-like acetyltransferase domain-containing protein n=1 Tax=Aquibium oceanicum TaxID=1670800 RepID=A0A1L3STB4_9HYPH|nr:GNAT family N-acetyltransferase [Aquibium oceanicum]APH72634.1 hypothetical protein BSQ44_15660 [Aquibium oceanicum]
MNYMAAAQSKASHPHDRPGSDSLSAASVPSAWRVDLRSEYDFLQPEYAELFAASDATAFQHPVWLHHIYTSLAPARRARMAVVTIRDAADRLVGLVPLILRTKTGVRLLETTDLGVSDYACPVLHRDVAAELLATPGLRERIASILPPHDIMRIRPIRSEHADVWQALLGGKPEFLGFSAHATELGDDHARWRAEKAVKSLRGRLSRAEKQIAKQGGATLHRLQTESDIRAALAAIQSLRAGRFDGDPIQEDLVRDFYAEAALAGANEGFAGLYRLDIDDAPAGYVFGLCWRGVYHYLLIGCDYQTYSRCSPGLVLYDRIIGDLIDRGDRVFDFTIGDEPFKADFGTEATPMFGLFETPTWLGRLARTAFEARERRKRARDSEDGAAGGK